MINCIKCNTDIAADSIYCGDCGAKVEQEPIKENPALTTDIPLYINAQPTTCCSRYGKKDETHGDFCVYCGSQVSNRKPTTLLLQPTTCIQCGYELDESAEYCPKCGMKSGVTENICITCSFEMSSDDVFCKKCGTRKVNAQEKNIYCRYCGVTTAPNLSSCQSCGSIQDNSATSLRPTARSDKSIFLVLAIIASTVCIILQFQGWISLQIGFIDDISVFRAVVELGDLSIYLNRFFGVRSDSLDFLIAVVVLVCIFMVLSMIGYITSIIRIITKSTVATTSGGIALTFLTIAFALLAIIVFGINSNLDSATNGLIRSVIGLRPISYITVILGFINYFAFVKNSIPDNTTGV